MGSTPREEANDAPDLEESFSFKRGTKLRKPSHVSLMREVTVGHINSLTEHFFSKKRKGKQNLNKIFFLKLREKEKE